MARQILSLLLMLSLLLLFGCWDRRETEELLLLDALAFDIIMRQGVQHYQVTFVSSKPAGGGGAMGMGSGGEASPPQQWIAKAEGRTMEEAILDFTTRAPRYMYFEHNTIILIGEDMARAGVSEILDFLIRKQGVRLRNYIFVTKGSALALLSAQPEFESTLAREIQALLERGNREGDYFHQTDLNLFSQAVLTPGKDPWAPAIEAFRPTETEEEKQQLGILMKETALFRSDKLIDFLSQQETQSFLILSGLAERGVFSVRYRGGLLAFVYHEAAVSRKLVQRNNSLELDFQVTIKGVVEEIHVATELLEQDLKEMETLLSRTAERDLQKTIEKCQGLGVDVFSIGREIHARRPGLWKDYKDSWEEIYQKMNINLSVTVEITGTNLGFKPIIPRNRE